MNMRVIHVGPRNIPKTGIYSCMSVGVSIMSLTKMNGPIRGRVLEIKSRVIDLLKKNSLL